VNDRDRDLVERAGLVASAASDAVRMNTASIRLSLVTVAATALRPAVVIAVARIPCLPNAHAQRPRGEQREPAVR